jgi:hypothetical protein
MDGVRANMHMMFVLAEGMYTDIVFPCQFVLCLPRLGRLA